MHGNVTRMVEDMHDVMRRGSQVTFLTDVPSLSHADSCSYLYSKSV